MRMEDVEDYAHGRCGRFEKRPYKSLTFKILLVGADAVSFADSVDFEDGFAEGGDCGGVGDEYVEVAGEDFLVGLDVEAADVDVEGCRNHAGQLLEDTVAVYALDADVGEEAAGDVVPAGGHDARTETGFESLGARAGE